MTTSYDRLARTQQQLDAQAGELDKLLRYNRDSTRRATLQSLVSDERIVLDVDRELHDTSLFDDDQFAGQVEKFKTYYARTPANSAADESAAAVAWACAVNERAGEVQIRGDILARYRRAVAAQEAPSPDRYDHRLGTFKDVW